MGLSCHSRFCVSCGKNTKRLEPLRLLKLVSMLLIDILLGPLINLYAISLDYTKNYTMNFSVDVSECRITTATA